MFFYRSSRDFLSCFRVGVVGFFGFFVNLLGVGFGGVKLVVWGLWDLVR